MSDIPQRLYDSEINFSISCFYDGGFLVKIGDEINGFIVQTTVSRFEDGLAWLDQKARETFPSSLYATGKHPEG